MAKGKSKKRKYSPTVKQRKAIEQLVVFGGNVTEAMKKAGYSDNTAHTPSKLTSSRAYIDVLNRNGLDDESLSQAHQDLMRATIMDERVFPAIRSRDNKKIAGYVQKIKDTIEKNPNHKFLFIIKDREGRYVATFQRPENISRRGAIDMAYKVKGHFAPIKVDAPVGGYNLDQKDKEKLDDIFNGD